MSRLKGTVQIALSAGYARQYMPDATSLLPSKKLKVESKTAARKRREREAKEAKRALAAARQEGGEHE